MCVDWKLIQLIYWKRRNACVGPRSSRLDLCEQLALVSFLKTFHLFSEKAPSVLKQLQPEVKIWPLWSVSLLMFWAVTWESLAGPLVVGNYNPDAPWWIRRDYFHFSVICGFTRSLLCVAPLSGNQVRTTTLGTFNTLSSKHNREKKRKEKKSGEFAQQDLYVVLLGPSVFVSQTGSHLPLWLSWLDFVIPCDLTSAITHAEWRFYWPVASLR